MRLELTVLAGAALVAGSILFIGRYEISAVAYAYAQSGDTGQTDEAVYRLDRWTGEIELCRTGMEGRKAIERFNAEGRMLVTCKMPKPNQ